MAAQFASTSVAGREFLLPLFSSSFSRANPFALDTSTAAYDYYQQPHYQHTSAYPAPVTQWSRQPQQHPALSPALWGEFNPQSAPSARSSVVEMSYTSESPIMSDQQWHRRASEGALPHLQPQRQGGDGMRPDSASSSLANWSFPPSSNAPSSNHQPASMIPAPIAPSTYSANASPVLAEQSLPELPHPQQFMPQSAPHGYYVSPPPGPLPHHSPSTPTPTQPNPLTAGPAPHLGDPSFAQQPSAAGKAANPKSPSGANAHKRGRKPKNYVKTAEDERVEREEYLERNRLAALKSRQRKKQRMGNLEARSSSSLCLSSPPSSLTPLFSSRSRRILSAQRLAPEIRPHAPIRAAPPPLHPLPTWRPILPRRRRLPRAGSQRRWHPYHPSHCGTDPRARLSGGGKGLNGHGPIVYSIAVVQ
jgi:hypothetical protein